MYSHVLVETDKSWHLSEECRRRANHLRKEKLSVSMLAAFSSIVTWSIEKMRNQQSPQLEISV